MQIFGLATGFYVAAFAAAVYSATESVTTRTVSVLFVTALPALLATEICGGDSKASQALVESWIKEFVGTAVMVAATCSPGAVVGHYGTHCLLISSSALPRLQARMVIARHNGFHCGLLVSFASRWGPDFVCSQGAGVHKQTLLLRHRYWRVAVLG